MALLPGCCYTRGQEPVERSLPGKPRFRLISDGEATVPLQPGSDPASDALNEARRLRQEEPQVLLITASATGRGAGVMPQLAEALGTVCHRLHALQAGRMLELIERTRASH